MHACMHGWMDGWMDGYTYYVYTRDTYVLHDCPWTLFIAGRALQEVECVELPRGQSLGLKSAFNLGSFWGLGLN